MTKFADTVEAGVFFVLGVGEETALLDQDSARRLRDDLNEFLGADKQPGAETAGYKVGDVIPSNSKEPDLPMGSLVQDDSDYQDIAKRVETGWVWVKVLGKRHEGPDPVWNWEYFNEFNWKVLRVGE